MVRARKKHRQEPKSLPPNTKGQKAKGRNVGKLMKILDVPMEVFLEIASYLQPVDILQLSRASRNLRSTLLSRSSRHVWTAAFENVEPPLPDCPPSLSEPEYAYIVFERFCQLCGAGRATFVDYAIRVRLCSYCWTENVKRGHQLAKEMNLKKDKKALRVIYDLVPRATRESFKSDGEVSLEDVQQISRDLFYGPQFIEAAEQYLNLRDEGDEEALQEFIQESIEITDYDLIFHREMIEWTRDAREDKKAAGEDAEIERCNAIAKRLLELGWTRDDWPRHKASFDAMIYQPRPLSERIWNTIRPKLVALLDQERRKRAADHFEFTWSTRSEQLLQYYRAFLKRTRDPQQQHILPSFGDALELPCMHDLLTSKEPKEDITPGDFSAIEPTIMVEAEEYRDKVYSNLVRACHEHLAKAERLKTTGAKIKEDPVQSVQQKKPKGKKKAEPAPEPSMDRDAQLALLNKPTTIFKCNGPGNWGWNSECNTNMSYIGIMEHWRTFHDSKPCSDSARADDNDGDMDRDDMDCFRRSLPQLLDAVGLATNTTHAELHRLVTSGRPVCSCGKDLSVTYKGKVPTYALLATLRSHIRQGEEYGWRSENKGKVHDRITFEPFDEGGQASSPAELIP
ncbi:hypothetical protein K466DRAFT_521175 [Polyporus arcularius HHB13444]|uniref:F-box domain-containing protein n=1 Tax=Polyporus arcularius HHB13444 TaxID=1314778 RepID=A0A5C3PG55_9APHY|nr:hypothetical protein K466DRAFT_521175 [Polyporus arcularius HHB13444]